MTRWLFALLLLLPSLAVAQTSRGPVDAQNFGTTPFLTPGSTTARTDAARWGDVRNAVDWGADPTGVADSTAALNNALATDASGVYHNVYMPPGNPNYQVTNSVTVHQGQCLTGDSENQPAIVAGYNYNSAGGSPLVLSGTAAPCAKNLNIEFTQPTSIGSRGNFATLAAGCGGNGKGCEYPAAINLTAAANAHIENVQVQNAWDCATATWATSNAAVDIINFKCGAFDKGLNFSGSTGVVNLSNYSFFPYGITTANNSAIYADGNTFAAVLSNMQDFTAANLFDFGGRFSVTGSSWNNVTLTNPEFDGDNATFEFGASGGFATITGAYSSGSSTGANTACEIQVTAGTVTVSTHELQNNTDSNAASACVSAGNLILNGVHIPNNNNAASSVSQTGGVLAMNGGISDTGSGTWSVPLIKSTAGIVNLQGVTLGGAGSGTAISTVDGASNIVSGNTIRSGWTFVAPAGASILGKYYPNAGGPTFAVSQGAPSNPTGTTSTAAFVMMGMAQAFTPAINGKVQLHFDGICTNSGANDALEFQLRYGTGTAPINGAALAGSAVSSTVPGAVTVSAANQWFSCSQIQIVAGLTVGTAYWYDVAVEAVTGGTAALANVTMNANELP